VHVQAGVDGAVCEFRARLRSEDVQVREFFGQERVFVVRVLARSELQVGFYLLSLKYF
jgi:hypothetical protein